VPPRQSPPPPSLRATKRRPESRRHDSAHVDCAQNRLRAMTAFAVTAHADIAIFARNIFVRPHSAQRETRVDTACAKMCAHAATRTATAKRGCRYLISSVLIAAMSATDMLRARPPSSFGRRCAPRRQQYAAINARGRRLLASAQWLYTVSSSPHVRKFCSAMTRRGRQRGDLPCLCGTARFSFRYAAPLFIRPRRPFPRDERSPARPSTVRNRVDI